MASFRRSLAINFLASSGATIVQFVVSLIVARILTPAEIGVYSIAVVLVAVAHVFREFGVGSFLQRAEHLDRDQVRSAMGVAYVLALATSAVVFLAARPVAAYYGYPEIAPVMHVLALSFLVIPFSSVALALLLREYDATRIAMGTAAGTAAYTIVCIALALGGLGALSLAWANLANVIATGIAYVVIRPRHMSYLPRFRECGDILRFGSGALFTNLVSAANDAVPDLVLGKIGTARQVGLVSRANSTVRIFLYVAGSAMTFGSQTYLSKAFHAKESLEPMLHRAISLVTGIGWPMLAVTAIAAEDIIVALYGSTWIEAAPAVVPLAMMAAIDLAFHYKTSAFNAVGRPYLASIPLLVTVVLRVSLGVALFTGTLESFAWALMASTAATAPVWLILQRNFLGCGVRSFLRMLMPSALVALACAVVAYAALQVAILASITSPFLRVAFLAMPTGLAWILALKALGHPLFEELMLLVARLRRQSGTNGDTAGST